MPHDHPSHSQGPDRAPGPDRGVRPHGHGHHGHGHHGHGHHGHGGPQADFTGAFALGILLNAGFVAVEVAVGLYAGSLALLADAGHNATDVLSMILAWGAAVLARRPPGARHTYGLGKATVMASVTNGVLLVAAVGAIGWEAVQRIATPSPVAAGPVLVTAAIGVVINTLTALLFLRGQHDLNVRGAFLHMVADAAVSAAVVLSAGLMLLTDGLEWLDPALSLVIVAVILYGSWGLLRDSAAMALDAAPAGIDVAEVRAWLAARPGVTEVHDLHVWSLSTTRTALTAHLVRPSGEAPDAFLAETTRGLAATFGIDHATLQVETGDLDCELAPDEVV
ncbi:cation diffusion facilitator family transporter [Phenylobacterium sp.]|uniref:cation diffusion facilitator family transporter n=1 Tax=Phenylobacterium sp. TaxID=1871053 RepID=UPI0025DDA931|nr:cation diffusion facilitator family transporter [Phenylobacterium sp.]MCA3720801.1 cation transporter [Phenylobacterium sp.]